MKWKNPAVPRLVVQMMPVDDKGRLFLMKRGPNVRSARNCYSFPSGVQKIGEYWYQCAVRELDEEYGLAPVGAAMPTMLGFYENIAPERDDPDQEEQFHWSILVVAVRVADVEAAVNKEPHKHPWMGNVPIPALDPANIESFIAQYPFHESFNSFLRANPEGLYNKLRIASLPS